MSKSPQSPRRIAPVGVLFRREMNDAPGRIETHVAAPVRALADHLIASFK